jgi:hypothetical protein
LSAVVHITASSCQRDGTAVTGNFVSNNASGRRVILVAILLLMSAKCDRGVELTLFYILKTEFPFFISNKKTSLFFCIRKLTTLQYLAVCTYSNSPMRSYLSRYKLYKYRAYTRMHITIKSGVCLYLLFPCFEKLDIIIIIILYIIVR